MNFYIGNSIQENNCLDENVEVTEKLIEYIYKMRRHAKYDMSILYTINPYDDVELSGEEVLNLIEICKYILQDALLENYNDEEEGEQMLRKLIEIAQRAVDEGEGLISIGD